MSIQMKLNVLYCMRQTRVPNDLSDHLFDRFYTIHTRAFDATLKVDDDDDGIGEVRLTFSGLRIFIAYLRIDATMYDILKH